MSNPFNCTEFAENPPNYKKASHYKIVATKGNVTTSSTHDTLPGVTKRMELLSALGYQYIVTVE